MSFLVIGSSNGRPISRLMAKKVRSGLVTACRLAGWPTRRSPSSVNATIEGVVRAPSEFSMTLGVAPSMTATQELVVPRSMPITLAIATSLFFRETGGPRSGQALDDAKSGQSRPILCVRSPMDCPNSVGSILNKAQPPKNPSTVGRYIRGAPAGRKAQAPRPAGAKSAFPFLLAHLIGSEMKRPWLAPALWLIFAASPATAQFDQPTEGPRPPAPLGDDAKPAPTKPPHRVRPGKPPAPAEAATAAAIVGKPLLLNGSTGDLQLSGADDALRIDHLTLLGEVISDPTQQCKIDLGGAGPIEVKSEGRPDGVPRYSAAISGLSVRFRRARAIGARALGDRRLRVQGGRLPGEPFGPLGAGQGVSSKRTPSSSSGRGCARRPRSPAITARWTRD